MTLPFKLEYAVLCDLVRREDNGKLLLVGVYGPAVLIQSFPATLALSLVLKVRALGQEILPVNMEIRALLDREMLVSGDVALNVQGADQQDGQAFMTLPGIPMQIAKPGELAFQMRTPGDKWSNILKVDVRQA